MSFNRITYDQCAYDLQLDRSIAPGNYRLYPGYSKNCNECYQYNQPPNANNQPSDAKKFCDPGFGTLAQVESELTNRNKYLEKCNKIGKNDEYKKNKVYNKPLCDNKLEPEDTRFTFPIDNYRGMSLTSFYFTPYLHVNPQCEIQKERQREGYSTRQMVKDCYTSPEQNPWDNGGAFPPKTKSVPKKACKVCCK